MTLQTRKPTGKPCWPIMLLSGPDKSGKSFAAAVASTSQMVGRALWFSFGEDDPDEYGAIPGARFEIVTHDGTFRSLLAALREALAEPPATNGKPTLWVVDSMTRVWDLLSAEQQVIANDRARRKAQRFNRPVPDEDASITQDQWNAAKAKWGSLLQVLREHNGPVILTALLEEVSIVDAAGQPTKDKMWKVKAEKNLPSAVGVIVQMPERGQAWLTGVRSLRFQSKDARTEYPGFTVEKLWTDLGLAEKDATSPRVHTANDADDKPAAEAEVARNELRELAEANGWELGAVAAEWAAQTDGQPLKDSANAAAIRRFAAELIEQWKPKEKAA